jgi:hypothetical protein
MTSNTSSVDVPVNVPETTAVRVSVMNVLPPAVLVLVVVTVATAKAPVTGDGGVADAGTAARAAEAATTRTRSLRIVVLLSRMGRLPSLLRSASRVNRHGRQVPEGFAGLI